MISAEQVSTLAYDQLAPPDFSQANRDLEELITLSASKRFDLHGYLFFISQAGFPTFCIKPDGATAVAAKRRRIHYQLGEPLKALLSAMRAGDLNADKIQGSPGLFGLTPEQALSGGLFHEVNSVADINRRNVASRSDAVMASDRKVAA
jgi:hypothetical protein